MEQNDAEIGPVQVHGFLRGHRNKQGKFYFWLIDDFIADNGTEFEFEYDEEDDNIVAQPKTTQQEYKTVPS